MDGSGWTDSIIPPEHIGPHGTCLAQQASIGDLGKLPTSRQHAHGRFSLGRGQLIRLADHHGIALHVRIRARVVGDPPRSQPRGQELAGVGRRSNDIHSLLSVATGFPHMDAASHAGRDTHGQRPAIIQTPSAGIGSCRPGRARRRLVAANSPVPASD